MGFGHERRDGRRHLQTGHPPPGGVTGLAAQVHDGFNIFLRFTGQADHEIQLHLLPAVLEQLADMQHQPFFGDALVDDVAQALAARFGRKRSSGTPDARQTAHDVVVDGAHAQGRQGHGNLFRFAAVHRTEEQGFQRREVTRAEGKEGHVVETGVVQAVFEDFFQIRQAAFAGGTVQDARLTETATPGTPAGDFEAEAVVDRTERDHLLFGIGGPVEIRHDTASGRRQIRFQRREHAVGVMRVQRRRIDAGNVDGFLDKARTAPAFSAGLDHEVAQFRDHLLAFAEEHEVHERGERFRGDGASAARDDEGPAEQIVPAIGGAERDSGKFQHVQHVGKTQFMRDREREHVRLHDVRVAFQRGEADAVFAEEPAGFPAGGVHALGKDVFPIVEDGIQDFMSEVGHAHFVQIREGKGAVQANGRGLLVDGTFLGTDIVTGPGQQGEEFFHKEGFRRRRG